MMSTFASFRIGTGRMHCCRPTGTPLRIFSVRRKQGNLIRRSLRRVRASPLESDQTTAGEWLTLAFPHNEGFKDESDPALSEALNEISSMALAALLKEDEEEIIAVQDELYRIGDFFSKQGNRKAAVFMFILYKMGNHEIPKASDELDGIYLKAYHKIGGLLEDSGWELKMEGSQKNKDKELEE